MHRPIRTGEGSDLFRVFLLILAPLIMAFSVAGALDGDTWQALISGVIELGALVWLLRHRLPTRRTISN